MTSRGAFHSAILCCLFLTGISAAQSFLFVSPNTREHMSDEAAWSSLDSFEQSNFLAVANYLTVKLCATPKVSSAEGLDGSSTENSSLVSGCRSDKARYVGELLGRYAHQKWILVFDPDPRGNERLLIVTFSSDHPADTPKELRNSGITEGTIVIQDKIIRFYLWVKDKSQDAQIHSFVETHKATLEQIAGKGTPIGDDDRTAAQRIFDQRIHTYERAHHQSFSRLLWSRRLHDLSMTMPR